MHLQEADEGQGLPLWADLGLTALLTVIFVVLLRTFVVDSYRIPTGSMLDTIKLDNLLFGEKISYYFRAPQVGEVVTFADPEDPETTLIKRVIATEGQVVDLVDGAVVVDGVALDEPYVEGKPSDPIARHAKNLTESVSYPLTVPEGCLWVMGDNRTNSLDSRYFGPVDVSSIRSHAVFIYWPLQDMRTL